MPAWRAVAIAPRYGHGAKALVNALRSDAAIVLHGASLHALECTSADDTAPRVVDGVRLT